MQTIKELLAVFPRTGRLEWIGLAPAKRESLRSVDSVVVLESKGLEGDHHAKSGRSRRQVTMIQWEHLPTVSSLMGRDVLAPMLRRNLAISGINVLALKNVKFAIGDVVFEGTGPCEPCSRMEVEIGLGGYNAMRGHGGITTRVLVPGTIHVGDAVRFLPA